MKNIAKAGLALALLSLVVVAFSYRGQLDPVAISTRVESLGWLGAFAFVGIFAISTVAFLPGTVFALIGGALFGPFWGTALNLSGATLGATFSFFIARFVATDWVRSRTASRLQSILEGVDRQGWHFIAFIRLVPIFPFNLSNYALGLTRINLYTYVLTTFVCMIPGAAAFAWLGFAGKAASQGETSAIKYGLMGVGAMVGLALFSQWLNSRRTTPFEWIDAETLKSHIAKKELMTILDVRGADEFNGPLGHIPSSINIPLDNLLANPSQAFGFKPNRLILVCKTDKRSAKAAEHLKRAGYSAPIFVLKDGVTRWSAELMHE